MAKTSKLPKPSIEEKRLIDEYSESDRLLTSRIQDTRFGFDTFDRIYQTFIDPAKWPYSVKLATPRGFTAIYNKTTRMVGGRFTGRVEGNEQSDELGARIATEHFKWSVNRFNQHSDQPAEAGIAMWDTNTRLYGAGFLRVVWRTEKRMKWNPEKKKKELTITYDNWWIENLNNRDVLTQPGRESIQQSDYVIVRRYVSLDELEHIQEDGAMFDEATLNELKEAKTGFGKEANYTSPTKTIKGLDWEDDRFEICTTYYKDKWVTWCPKMGTKGKKKALILRTIENPYVHGEIPIVPLVYIPSQEDIYGMSQLQPVTALLKILSAIQSQFIELGNKELYPPTLVSTTEARIDTFKYRPKAFWLVNNVSNVSVLDQKASQSLSTFSEMYKMIVTEFLEAMGESGQGNSQVDLLGGEKTATEVKDRAFLRGARDNFDKLMLTGALRKVMYLIFEMLRDPKFTEKNTVIKIVGKDALEYFDKQGFGSWQINEAGYQLVTETADQLSKDEEFMMGVGDRSIYDVAYDMLLGSGALDEFAEPVTPVVKAKEVISKMVKSDEDNTGYLSVDPSQDYIGEFNFIPDVEALGMPDSASEYQARAQWYGMAKESEKDGSLQRDGFTIKHKDILSKLGELLKVKEADQYFKQEDGNGIITPGAGTQGSGIGGQGLPIQQAMAGNPGPVQQQAGPAIPPAGGPGMAGPIPPSQGV